MFFEDWNTADSLFGTSHEYVSGGYNENIQMVDNSRDDPSGSRTYRMQIAQVCDDAGNCLGTNDASSHLKDWNYRVYANTALLDTVATAV